jgi:hypothetical protein
MSLKVNSEPKQTQVAKAVAQTKKPDPKVFYVQKVIGGDTYLVMAQSQTELEDEFSNLYFDQNGIDQAPSRRRPRFSWP